MNNERERLERDNNSLQKQYEQQKEKINELVVKYNEVSNLIVYIF